MLARSRLVRESASLKNELSRVRRILEEMKRTVEKQSDVGDNDDFFLDLLGISVCRNF